MNCVCYHLILWIFISNFPYFDASEMEANPNYDIILSETTAQVIDVYKTKLLSNTTRAGRYLEKLLNDERIDLEETSNERFIELLLLTKKPVIYAESEIRGDGNDWNADELRILGDISIAMNVVIYDNGIWSPEDPQFRQYDRPLNGALLFTPGPLLDWFSRVIPPDFQEISANRTIDQHKYNRLIERRIAPLLYYANESVGKENRCAVITAPGIGTGQFAGPFRGRMGQRLNLALQSLLTKHSGQFPNISCIYFDPFRECTNEEHTFENVEYRVRPSAKYPTKPLLSAPQEYEEYEGDEFSNCKLFKIVAWDHVSYPGNDFFGDRRATDDGVSAAATNSMKMLTGIDGAYHNGKYLPPGDNVNWLNVVKKANIKLKANTRNIHIIHL